MGQETDNFRLILVLPLLGEIFTIFHEHLPTGLEKTFEIINNFDFWKNILDDTSDGLNTAPIVRVTKCHETTTVKPYRNTLRTPHVRTIQSKTI